jgi:hypothetical protein
MSPWRRLPPRNLVSARAALLGLLVCLLNGQALSEPSFKREINTLREIGPALRRCFTFAEGVQSFTVTIQASFNRQGGLIGPPDVTFSHFEGGSADKILVAAAIANALSRCVPLPFSESLGKAVAGRVFRFRFTNAAPGGRSGRA